MKNLQIKKALLNDIKNCDEYQIHVWAWTDGQNTWAEVIAKVDGEWIEGYEMEAFPFYERNLQMKEFSELKKEMKKVSKYLEKHFTNVNFHEDLQRV